MSESDHQAVSMIENCILEMQTRHKQNSSKDIAGSADITIAESVDKYVLSDLQRNDPAGTEIEAAFEDQHSAAVTIQKHIRGKQSKIKITSLNLIDCAPDANKDEAIISSLETGITKEIIVSE